MSTPPPQPVPHLLTPLNIRGRTLKNRIVISPMCQHAGRDGFVTDWHLVHYGKFVLGGAALVLAESTAVAADARVGVDDLGIWQDDHVAGLARLAEFAHANGALMGVQLAHAGRKAFSEPLWHGGRALTPEQIDALGVPWRRVGPSAIAASADWSVPQALDHAQIATIVTEHAAAARRADAAGMDVLELHFGHGYLVASFLSPHANARDDVYGGTRQNRMRLALEVACAVRQNWPDDKPLFARLSCVDGTPDGWSLEDSVVLAGCLADAGVDVIDCSSGGLAEETRRSNVPRGFGFQVPYAQRIRTETGVLTQAVGLITDAEQAEEIIAGQRADLVAIGREALRNPYWPLEAGRRLSRSKSFAAWHIRHGSWLDKREPVIRQLLDESGDRPARAAP